MNIKNKFLERYRKLTDIDKFLEYSLREPRKSIRVNTLKCSIEEIKKRFKNLEQIKWCKEGFWLKEYTIGNTLEHFLGYIYLQEASSMIPAIVLDPKENELVLDLCASPGSKTTQIAAIMNNKGLIVANDNKINRLKALSINLERCGVSNTVITFMNGANIKGEFDKVLVDAPCSGIGTLRKSEKTLDIWNENMIKKLANFQKKLILNGFNCLKKDGILVYSTCTLEPEENEEVVDFLLKKSDDAKLLDINLDIKRSDAILEFNGNKYGGKIKKCLRIWPQDNDTDGFFVAKITKTF